MISSTVFLSVQLNEKLCSWLSEWLSACFAVTLILLTVEVWTCYVMRSSSTSLLANTTKAWWEEAFLPVCLCRCVSTWWLHSRPNTVLFGWVRRPSLVIILSHLSLFHHIKKINQTIFHTNTHIHTQTDKVCSVVKWCLKWLNLGSGWSETLGVDGLLFLLETIGNLSVHSKLFKNSSTMHNSIIALYFLKLTPPHILKHPARDKESNTRRGVTVKAKLLVRILGGDTWGKGFGVAPGCLPVFLIEGKWGF